MKVLFILLLSVGCSHFSGSKKGPVDLVETRKRSCLTGGGRGRVQIGSNKYLFKFDSKVDWVKAQWIAEFYFPLFGEEWIQVNWASDAKPFEGSLVERFKRRKEKLSHLRDIFWRVRMWLSLLSGQGDWTCASSEEGTTCQKTGLTFSAEQDQASVVFYHKGRNGLPIQMKMSPGLLDSGKLTHIRIDGQTAPSKRAKGSAMALDLFFSNCNS